MSTVSYKRNSSEEGRSLFHTRGTLVRKADKHDLFIRSGKPSKMNFIELVSTFVAELQIKCLDLTIVSVLQGKHIHTPQHLLRHFNQNEGRNLFNQILRT